MIIDREGLIQYRDVGFGGEGEAYIERLIWRIDELLKEKSDSASTWNLLRGTMADNKGSDENVIAPGMPVIVYLHSPREKMWGLLTELSASGAFIHGIDLNTFEDWTMMLVRGERNIGLESRLLPDVARRADHAR